MSASRTVRRRDDPTTIITLTPTEKEESLVERDDARKYTCCNVSKMCTRWTVGFLSLFAAILIMIVGVMAYVSTENTIAIQRKTIEGVSGTLPGALSGLMTFNEGSRSISWNLFLQNSSLPGFSGLSLGIFGPITTSPNVLFAPLCGSPTGIVCAANATADQVLPQGYSLTTYITAIRLYPMWYEVKLCDAFGNCYVSSLGVSAGAP